ncbi:MAG TPA: nickel pincer cofactor biosynthesis protein LarC [Candidatus Methanoperedens sp.]|nr:nickel pincer cofactor biosynthesis protein LarC [Candidatus Methanoperedens sp.]
MTRAAFVNAYSGASGDMFLGALVDLGLDPADLEAALRRLPLPGLRLEAQTVTRQGLRACKVDARFDGAEPVFRTLAQVKEALRASTLDPGVLREAARAFERLATAEAEAHGATPGTVHFHELGSADTLIDVVGAIFGWRALGIGRAQAGPVNLGGGTVRSAHGIFPVPAPATARLLAGHAVFTDGEEGEKTTPTGALLLATLTTPAAAASPLPLERTGYGAGHADFPERPNCLQILLGAAGDDVEGEQVVVIETNLDDLSPQVIAYTIERLLREGAREAFVTPVVMKKGRPGHLLTAVVPDGSEAALGALVLRETGTLGYRVRRTARVVLRRREEQVAIDGGTVRVKAADFGGGLLRFEPEYEDCRRIAERTGRPLREVLDAARRARR